MRAALAGRIPLVVAVAVVFTVSFAAASQIDLQGGMAPALGVVDGTNCQDQPVVVGYSVSDGSVRALVLDGISSSCTDAARLTVKMSAQYLVQTDGTTRATSYTADLTSGTIPTLSIAMEDETAGTGVAFADYTTGAISVVILQKNGVFGTP